MPICRCFGGEFETPHLFHAFKCLWGSVACAYGPAIKRLWVPSSRLAHSFVKIWSWKKNSTTILSLSLIQEGQLSVTGVRMCTKCWGLLLRELIFYFFFFFFAFTAAGVVQCGGRKTPPRIPTIVQFIFYFWSFEMSVNILRNQK